MDEGCLVALGLVTGAYAVLLGFSVWAYRRWSKMADDGEWMETECLWCYDDFRARWMLEHPDELQPPYEPDFLPTLCDKHRRFREQIGETIPLVVATDGVADEYAEEIERGAWQ